MTLTHTGSTTKFAAGWQRIFGGAARGKAGGKTAKTRSAKTAAKKRQK